MVAGAYTPLGWIRLAWEVGLTRLFQPGARLIRRPLYLRGARNISFGKRITIGRGARIDQAVSRRVAFLTAAMS